MLVLKLDNLLENKLEEVFKSEQNQIQLISDKANHINQR